MEIEAEKKLRSVKKDLEIALNDAEANNATLMDEKQAVEASLKAASLKLTSLQKALDHKREQFDLNVQLAQNAVEEYKTK